MTFVNYYEVLEIEPTADQETIKSAIRKQRREWRNRSAHPRAETRALAERMTQHISDAERVLLDGAKRSEFDRQLAAQVESPPLDSSDSGRRDWISIIREYLANGNPSAANYAAREATSEQPNLAEAWYLRGRSSSLLQRLADAEYELGEAIRLRPNDAAYHAELADLYNVAGDWNLALKSYQRASELEPGNVYYRVGIASVYTAQERPDLALPILEQAFESNPESEFIRYHLVIALADDVAAKWSRFGDGSSAILNSAQLELTKKTLARIKSLRVHDPELNQHVSSLSRLTEEAERVQWAHDNLAAWVIGFVISLIALFAIDAAPLVGVIGLCGLIAIPLVFVKYNRVPGYVRNARVANDFVRKTGIQPLPGAVMNENIAQATLENIRHEIADLTDLFRRRLMDDKSKAALYETLQEQVRASQNLLRYRDLESLLREALLAVDRLQSDPNNPELVEAAVDELLEVFARRTLLRVDDSGEFDPRVHEALETVPANEHTPAGTIVRVHRAGYTLYGRLFRPTQVTVAIADTLATDTEMESVDANPA